MAKAIRDCLLEWKLDKVFTITVDNVSSNDVTVKELSKQCMAHILNLIVQDGLKELDVSVTRVRNIVRWNSTYLMLETAQNFENAFDKFHLFDDGFAAYQCSHLCEDGSSAGLLESDDWVNVRNVIEFLARFYKLTKNVSVSEDEHLRKMAERTQEKFKKYWGEPEKMNKMIFIASVLDPRNKFEYVEGVLGELFGEEKGKKINAEVYTYMNSLFGEYLKKYSTGSCPQSPSNSTSYNNTSNTSSGSVITASLIRTKLHLKKQKEDNGSTGAKSELDKHISEEQEPFNEEFDILSWWKTHAPRFPILSELARDVLAIPISSMAAECSFSTGGRILDSFMSLLIPKCVQALICVQDWLREEKNPISVEEDLKYLEELKLGVCSVCGWLFRCFQLVNVIVCKCNCNLQVFPEAEMLAEN
ncbi:zinc finger BED domain-containing protein RICESLEEPER 2-like [Nicotiana sylvestris]|uniref:zinc finger BED domain-containing protein RICESLEEPER 2-like n=1 Tax=Nicotiana sylvestris TaxID=4096 RepID=UPI00388C8CF2